MADNNIVEFQADLDAFAQLLDITVANVVRRIAFELYTKITRGWPVDTGYSRANWRLAVGEPDLTVLPPPPSGSAGQGEIYAPPDPDPAALVGIDGKEPVFITNNVDYAIYLEEGSSQQAPSGVVQVSVDQVEGQIADIIARAKP